jgi:hypothetical protein
LIQDNYAKSLILLGDFNAHLGYVGEQKVDKTGDSDKVDRG